MLNQEIFGTSLDRQETTLSERSKEILSKYAGILITVIPSSQLCAGHLNYIHPGPKFPSE